MRASCAVVGSIGITKRLRQILNARHFGFDSALVFTAQWFKYGGGVAHYLTRRYKLYGGVHKWNHSSGR
ncbi:hypothetical protein [Vibrio gallaecicus]|uniref:hypothetical protein n=1 Tax=Vibrio gallaecicus TaxID=552386 RepID=UPI0025B323DB|nr:hypothetical protein [Vibrio gallaecicus]MDN3617469.1 hypothetical protein [Vibrio gallaecicus]